MSDTVTPDMMVNAFLKAAQDAQIPAMVVYGPELGKPIIRVKTNEEDGAVLTTMRIGTNVGAARSAGILSWLTRVDTMAVTDIARALHTNGGAGGLISVEQPCLICGQSGLWDVLDEPAQQKHLALGEVAVGVLQRRATSLAHKSA